MTVWALMLHWSIPAPHDVRIASGTFHRFSPYLTCTANVPLFYHLILDAAFSLTYKTRRRRRLTPRLQSRWQSAAFNIGHGPDWLRTPGLQFPANAQKHRNRSTSDSLVSSPSVPLEERTLALPASSCRSGDRPTSRPGHLSSAS